MPGRGPCRGGRGAEPVQDRPARCGQRLDLRAQVVKLVAEAGGQADKLVHRALAGIGQRPDDRTAVAAGAIGKDRPRRGGDRRALGGDVVHRQLAADHRVDDEGQPQRLGRGLHDGGVQMRRDFAVRAVVDDRDIARRLDRRKVRRLDLGRDRVVRGQRADIHGLPHIRGPLRAGLADHSRWLGKAEAATLTCVKAGLRQALRYLPHERERYHDPSDQALRRGPQGRAGRPSDRTWAPGLRRSTTSFWPITIPTGRNLPSSAKATRCWKRPATPA